MIVVGFCASSMAFVYSVVFLFLLNYVFVAIACVIPAGLLATAVGQITMQWVSEISPDATLR